MSFSFLSYSGSLSVSWGHRFTALPPLAHSFCCTWAKGSGGASHLSHGAPALLLQSSLQTEALSGLLPRTRLSFGRLGEICGEETPVLTNSLASAIKKNEKGLENGHSNFISATLSHRFVGKAPGGSVCSWWPTFGR